MEGITLNILMIHLKQEIGEKSITQKDICIIWWTGYMTIESYSDGSGKNASGRGAASFLIVKDQSIIHQEAFLLVNKTNNEAEYIALHAAVDYLCKEGYDRFTCYVDSELVYKQLIGEYRVNVPELITWNNKIKLLLKERYVAIKWVPRDNGWIKQADAMNNRIMRYHE